MNLNEMIPKENQPGKRNQQQYQYQYQNQNNNIRPHKRKRKFPVSIILALLAIAVGVYGGYFILDYVKTEQEKNKTEINEEPENKEEILMDEEVKKQLDRFIKVASYNDNSGNGMFYYIAWGLPELTEAQKIKLTYYSVIKIDHLQAKITEIPEKYIKDVSMPYLNELPIETFNNEYRNLFHEEPTYNIETIGNVGCPAFYMIDTELGKMYLSDDCNDTTNNKYFSKTIKYTYDNDYYYVYQYVGEVDNTNYVRPVYKKIKSEEIVNVNSFYGNEERFETLMWKFDKDLHFISTNNIK